MLEVLLIALAAFFVVAIAIVVIARVKPQLLAPVMKLLLRSKRFRAQAERQVVNAAAENPELISEMTEGLVGRREAEMLERQLAGRSEAERRDVLTKSVELAQSGRVAEAQALLAERPKTLDDRRAQAKRKSKTRAKNKQARASRKRSR